MKQIIFFISTVLSILGLLISGLLYAIYFTQESPGMIMIFLGPALLVGILLGVVALALKYFTDVTLSRGFVWIHNLHLALLVAGIIGWLYFEFQ